MTEYDPRPELMATQQSLFEEYEPLLNQEIEENVALLSHLSQREQTWERVPHEQIQQVLEWEKQNASKLFALKNFKEELLSEDQEQHFQLGAWAQSSRTDSK